MARARTGKSIVSLKVELNLPRLGIFSMQQTLSEDPTKWVSVFSVGDRTFHVLAEGTRGRPHGLDNDVILAVSSLFIDAGCPEDNLLSTTAYALRQACGWHNNGAAYAKLRTSLFRIYFTGAEIREGYFDSQRKARFWQGDTYRLIERIRYRDVDSPSPEVQLDGEGRLLIGLGEQFADSIRSGYAVLLDEVTYRSLQQPTSRALYTMLEAHRRLPEDPEERVVRLEVDLMQWRTAVGIQSERPEIIRRALNAAHDELREAGYLREAEYVGRGKKQSVHYTFGQAVREPDPRLVERLVQHGVVRGVANRLVLDHPAETLAGHIDRYEALLAAGLKPRTRGALLVDLIKNPEKYGDPEGYVTPAARELQAARSARAKVEAERRASRQVDEQREALERLTPEERLEATFSTLRVLIGHRLPPARLDALHGALRDGRLDPDELRQTLVTAAAERQLDAAVAALRAALDQPE